MKKNSVFKSIDSVIILFISFLSLFMRLWNIQFPDVTVFDEVHFGNFTNWYIQESFFFDIHPPLAKLIMAGIAKLTDYPGHIVFNKLDPFYNSSEISYVSLRITPAIIQSFCFPLIYCAMLFFGFYRLTSLSTSLILMCETSILAEGRYILSDGILHFFVCLTIFSLSGALYFDSVFWYLFAGISLGCSISCKNTAMGLIAFVGITQLFWIYEIRPQIRDIAIRASIILVPTVFVFIFSYIIHLIVLPYHGQGTNYMPPIFQSTLIHRNSFRWPRIVGMGIFDRIISLNQIMHQGNMKIISPHPSQSNPKYWPFLRDKWVVFFSSENRNVFCIGSPSVYYPSSFCIMLTIIAIIAKQNDKRTFILFCGWVVSYLPFLLIPRSMYLYHYIIPLVFAVMNMTSILEKFLSKTILGFLLLLLVFAAVINCIIFFPIVSGSECNNCISTRRWSIRWSDGPPSSIPCPVIDQNTTILYGKLPQWS